MKIGTKLAHKTNYASVKRNPASIRYIVIHYTGNQGDTAKNNVDYFARESVGVSAHYFVDETDIWQSVPDSYTAWHCGTNTGYYHPACRNQNSIGIEICMLDKACRVRHESINHASKLVRYLMSRYAIAPENVVRHYDVTHKKCPAPMVQGATLWENFRKGLVGEVEKQEEDYMPTVYESLRDVPEWARECVSELIDKGYLKGDGDSSLDLEHYMLRGLVINWRAGLYK